MKAKNEVEKPRRAARKLRERYIAASLEDIAYIHRTLGVTRRFVYMALRFDTNGERSQLIRQMALARGAQLKVVVPEVETWFDANGYMYQRFLNGALLLINKKTGHGVLHFKGEQVWQKDNLLLTDVEAIQARAAALK